MLISTVGTLSFNKHTHIPPFREGLGRLLKNFITMDFNFDLDAIAKAAAALKAQNHAQAQASQPKSTSTKDTKSTTKRASKTTAKSQNRTTAQSAPKSETKEQVKCVADPAMVQALTGYLYSRPDMIGKLANPDKSIEGCCSYIIGKMQKRAEKARKNGASSVGVFAKDDEVYGMAVHYFDESEEDLKKEAEDEKD